MSKCKVIALANQKGGTAKTTTTLNLGIGLAHQGRKVLLVDADPQGDLTTALGWTNADSLPITLETQMKKILQDEPFVYNEGILHHKEGVDIIPTNIELSGLEISLVNAMSREQTLKLYLADLKKDYDYILIDCIGEYVELIKAIMMQESGGRGLDPMQCSEGSFNTKYPRQPNGITDPEYSISCGVQEIKSCLERAGVKNPLDMENIKLALQSYNYGNGYLEWAKARGGYTLANAAEFSDMMAQRMGWSSYGDKQYVPHVLQYKGRFRDGSYTPAAGDIIFFDWGNNGTIDHVGIVESVSGGTVNTIEGNSGDKVARRSYSIGSSNIYGYGVPAY